MLSLHLISCVVLAPTPVTCIIAAVPIFLHPPTSPFGVFFFSSFSLLSFLLSSFLSSSSRLSPSSAPSSLLRTLQPLLACRCRLCVSAPAAACSSAPAVLPARAAAASSPCSRASQPHLHTATARCRQRRAPCFAYRTTSERRASASVSLCGSASPALACAFLALLPRSLAPSLPRSLSSRQFT